ncbi:response regulator transcription factor [Niabella terrae]
MSQETNLHKPQLLIIDDNEDILEFLNDDLGEQYQILTATGGHQALELLDTEVVHLVISDVMMPEMDGFELCGRIKSGFQTSHIPVILLTARDSLQSKIDGLNQGADAYIEKPFSPEHLAAQVSSLLTNREKVKTFFIHSPLVQINSIAHSKIDEAFLEELNNFIIDNITNDHLDVDHMAQAMNMSRPTLYRKLKSVSDLSPNEMINLSRLKKAVELMHSESIALSEIAQQVGYSSLTHFGRNFQKQFGLSPSEYLQQTKS